MLLLCRSYSILMCDHPIRGHFGKPKVKLKNQQTTMTSLTSKKWHQSRGCITPYSTLMPNCDRYFWRLVTGFSQYIRRLFTVVTLTIMVTLKTDCLGISGPINLMRVVVFADSSSFPQRQVRSIPACRKPSKTLLLTNEESLIGLLELTSILICQGMCNQLQQQRKRCDVPFGC